jgi:ribosomal protein S18 acetylase RimI-like enzyme
MVLMHGVAASARWWKPSRVGSASTLYDRRMELRELDSAESFLAQAATLLLRDEPRHNLIFGICSTLRDAPAVYPEFHLWTVEDEGDVVAAALMTPPFNLALAQPHDADTLPFLAEELHRRRVELPGVTAALPEAEAFAAAWGRVAGVGVRPRMRQGIYGASRAREPEGVPGRMRRAVDGDRKLLVDWLRAFGAESLPSDAPHFDAEAAVERRLAGTTGEYVLWETDEPVSLAGFGGRTPHGIRIGPVYTPPPLRRRGYASALVGTLTRDLLAGDADFCFLYTDLANPTSNRIYQDVGYELVAESVDYAFDTA